MFVSKNNLQFIMHSPGYFLHKKTRANKIDVRGFSQMSFDVEEEQEIYLMPELLSKDVGKGLNHRYIRIDCLWSSSQ